jgi:hypothetical protein
MRLRLLSAQPATDYYAWQVEVYLHNAIELKYNGNFIDVVAGYIDSVPKSWRAIQQKFPYVRFFFYEDTRVGCNYAPAMQAHVLEKHFKQHPYLSEEAIFFHDCDFLFTRYFDFSPYLNDDNWYFSDTINYIGANYIKSKGDEVLNKMCEIVGIDRNIVEANQASSGGAQKLMKGIDSSYWSDVYRDAVNLYNGLGDLAKTRKEGDPYGIQIWCASMWSELWNGWKRGKTVVVPKEFDFAWATCPVARWDKVPFFHNAGVPDNKQKMFFKAEFINKYPFDSQLDIGKERCSYKYYEYLKSIDSCLIDK